MSSNSLAEKEPGTAVEKRSRFEELSDEAVSLRIVEKFLSEVEKATLRATTPPYPIAEVKEGLRKLRNQSSEFSAEELLFVESDLIEELRTWRENLQDKDSKLETFHLRRFCDSIRGDLTKDILLAISRFYLDFSDSPAGQSKFDLFITRAFESEAVNADREPRLPREAVTARLGELFGNWGCAIRFSSELSDEANAAVNQFDEFVAEAENLPRFEDLIESNLFERIRSFKRQLGVLFYEPAVVSAAIECNLAVGNVFRVLLAKANETLGARLNAEFDFAGAFLDTSDNASDRIAEALRELHIVDFESGRSRQSDELVFLSGLLKQAAAGQTEAPPAKTPEEASETDSHDEPQTVRQRLAPVLCALVEQQPDPRLLRDQMDSLGLGSIDLNDFLFATDKEPDQIGRQALAVILCLEEIRLKEFKEQKTLAPETHDEIIGFLQRAEELGEALTMSDDSTDQREHNRMLIVSNKLLETRLRIERSIVRFTSEQPEPEQETAEPEEVEVVADQARPKTNRWLIAATAVVVLVCGSIMLFSRDINSASPLAEDVEEYVVSRLPQGEHLETAHRFDVTLFVTAKSSWAGLPDDEKRKNLQELLMMNTEKPLEAVVIVGSDGNPLGDFSRNGLNVFDETVADGNQAK